MAQSHKLYKVRAELKLSPREIVKMDRNNNNNKSFKVCPRYFNNNNNNSNNNNSNLNQILSLSFFQNSCNQIEEVPV